MNKLNLLLLILFVNNLYPQNSDPTPIKLDYQNEEKELNEIVDEQVEFALGWQWYANPKLSSDNALNFNIAATHNTNFLLNKEWYINSKARKYITWDNFELIDNNETFVPNEEMLAISTIKKFPFYAQGVLLEPSLQIDPNDYEYEVVDDYLNPIFGFENVNGSVVQRGQSSKLLIETSLFLGEKVEILSKPYTTSMLKKLFETSQDQIEADARGEETIRSQLIKNLTDKSFESINGEDFYLTFNINRVDALANNNLLDENILEIKMPCFYVKKVEKPNGTINQDESKIENPIPGDLVKIEYLDIKDNYQQRREYYFIKVNDSDSDLYDVQISDFLSDKKDLKFRYKPSKFKNIILDDNGDRGLCTENSPIPYNGSNVAYLNNQVLPYNADPITLSFVFSLTRSNLTGLYNGKINETKPNEVYEIGLEINYLGGYDIEIDWIRIENFLHRNIILGFYDLDKEYLEYKDPNNKEGYLSFKDQVQDVIDEFDTYNGIYKLFRLMPGNGDDGSRLNQLTLLRYFNKLFPNSSAVSIAWPSSNIFGNKTEAPYHHIGFDHNWINGQYQNWEPIVPYYIPSNLQFVNSNNEAYDYSDDSNNPPPPNWYTLGYKHGLYGPAEYKRLEVINGNYRDNIEYDPSLSPIIIRNSFYETGLLNSSDYYPEHLNLKIAHNINTTPPTEPSINPNNEYFLNELWKIDYLNPQTNLNNSIDDLNIERIKSKMYRFMPVQLSLDKVASHYEDNSLFYFNDKNWWAQFFIHFTYSLNSSNGIDKDRINFIERFPWTGEQVRLYLSNSLIMGTKGIMIDASSGPFKFKEYDSGIPGFTNQNISKDYGFVSTLPGRDILESVDNNEMNNFIDNDEVGNDCSGF